MAEPLSAYVLARLLEEARAEADALRGWVDQAIEADRSAQRLYLLLALFDHRDGTFLSDLVQLAREGYERSHPDMGEEDAWRTFDALWAKRGDYTVTGSTDEEAAE